jgi:hypothetical protein
VGQIALLQVFLNEFRLAGGLIICEVTGNAAETLYLCSASVAVVAKSELSDDV